MFKEGSTYYSIDKKGVVLDSSTTCEDVLATAVAGGGTTRIVNGSYLLSAGFTGVDISNNKTLELDPNAQFSVPNGYTGYVFRIPTSIEYVNIRGGRLMEAGTAAKLWTGVKFDASGSNGIAYCGLRDMYIDSPGVGISLSTSGSTGAFVNGCVFDNLYLKHPIVGVDFASNATGGGGLFRNIFNAVKCQDSTSSHDTLYGFKNIRNKDNVFISCMMWDMNNGSVQRTATIHEDAQNTVIIGGAITRSGGYFVDDSRTTTIIMDEFGPPLKHGNVTIGESSFHAVGKRRRGVANFCSTISADGLMAGGLTSYAAIASNVGQVSTTDGVNRLQTTAATTGSGAGQRYSVTFTARALNPIYRLKFKLNQITPYRCYFGWTSANADLAGEDPLNALSGVMLTKRAADTTWFIGCNDGTGATTFTDTALTRDTAIHRFELVCNNSLTNPFRYSIDGGAYVTITDTNIPAAGTELTAAAQIQTSEDVAKSVNLYALEVEST